MRIIFLAAILVGLMQPAAAEQARGASRKSQPAQAGHTAPDTTGAISQPNAPQASDKERDEPLSPFNLPAAPRSRMRACGQKWQEVKMSGRAGDQTWREFATKCLTEEDGAGRKSQP